MHKEIFNKQINNILSGKTIKDILKNHLKLSNRIIINLKNNKGILLNEENVFVNKTVNTGDILKLYLRDEISENITPQDLDLDIIYEDNDLIIINKPPNLVVHPTTGYFTNTLANGIMYYFAQKGIQTKFRPVNRLDKDTSGLVLIAKSQLSHYKLSNQLIDKTFKKEYFAVVRGQILNDGTIDLPIARKFESIIEREVNITGQRAITEFKIVVSNNDATLVRINLVTGRTHQIRVHFSHINHPLLGDCLYGESRELVKRQALHCGKLEFVHPTTNIPLNFEAKLPNDIIDLLKMLNLDYLL